MIDTSPHVAVWLQEKGFRLDRCVQPILLGWRRGGKIVAAVVYEGFNGRNVWAHIVSDGTRRWLSRRFLYAMFHYPFVVMGATRISGRVEAGRLDAVRFDQKLGFTLEGVQEGAAADGDDVLIFRMFRDECRFL